MTDLIVIFKDELILLLTKIIRQEIGLITQNKTDDITNNKEEIINVTQMCILLKISKPTLYKKMKDGTIPYTRIGRRILFKRNEVINSLKRRN